MLWSPKRTAILCYSLLIPSSTLWAQPNRIAFDDNRRVVLPDSVHPKARPQYDQGPVDPSLKIGYITLMLNPSAGQQATLDQLLVEQQDRSSPNYHRWLTPEQFGDGFGLSTGDYAAAVSWIESQGLHIEDRARARNWVAFSGSAKQVSHAFQTEIHRFLVNGETHFANTTPLRIPAALDGRINGVRGLNDFWKRPDPKPEFTTSSGVHQLAPADWATIYDVTPLYNMGIDGTGQRLVILGRSDMNQSFVDSFRSMFGLAPSQIEMHLIGPDPGVTNAAGEAALDLEWSGAIARNATIVYVYSNNFFDAAQASVDQNLAPVMSLSFGTCEPEGVPGNRAIAQQANAQGITWLASSGDSGPAGCDPHGIFGSTQGGVASLGLAVSIPASFPEVTAMGGTEFNEGSGQYWQSSSSANGGSAISYIPEMVWNDTPAGGGLLTSGGGASIDFPKPSWQTGPGVPKDNARDVPDVSFNASGDHDGYMVVNANGQVITGGTSASSPSFAGVIALLNQYVVTHGFQTEPGLGNINPDLYRLAQTTTNIFHDITQGNDIVPCAQGSPDCVTGSYGFTAAPGYDLATGLGSIDVANLVTAWPAPNNQIVVTASPASITLGDTVQLTATIFPLLKAIPLVVLPGQTAPTGTVTFSTGTTILGSASVVNVAGSGMSTFTVSGPVLPAGATTVVATYSGDSNFNGAAGSVAVQVASPSTGSSVLISITPNPAHAGQSVRLSLTEENGVGTTITSWTINGSDRSSLIVPDFGSASLPAYGTVSTSFATTPTQSIPAVRLYQFTGMDADGRTWSQQYTLTLVGTSAQDLVLSSASGTCPQLLLEEQNGLEVQLTRFLVDGQDITNKIQTLFGTTRLAPFGALQATFCGAGSIFELDGITQIGEPAEATLTGSYQPLSSGSGTPLLSGPVTLSAPGGSGSSATATITSNLRGSNPAVSVFPSNQTTSWLTATVVAQQVSLVASSAGLANGVYNATLILQATTPTPQAIEIPVVFEVGPSSAMSIGGVSNGASFQPAFAPGMILSVFGTQLAPSTQLAAALPLPLALAGVSASVNGIAAPLYYVSPGQLNIQIPYETGAGSAVLGVNNNGQVASYVFTVAPSAPGIFTDSSGALIPFSSGKSGDTLTLFITGDGDVLPALATGASPFTYTPVALLPQPRLPLSITVGGVTAAIAFVGIPPGLAGVTQVNFVIPPNVSPGPQPVVVTVGGVASNTGNLTVTP
jgi:uncharacterized protein (TIGR03437 family)